MTTMKDEKGRQVAADLLHGVTERVYPVGRLDMYSEGMLLFTNDGELTNRLTHPAHHIPKKYVVTIRGTLTAADAARFTEPMTLDGYALRPVEAALLTVGDEALVILQGAGDGGLLVIGMDARLHSCHLFR